jgi:C4-dicarboxylate-specific signal transduction histidine kinase
LGSSSQREIEQLASSAGGRWLKLKSETLEGTVVIQVIDSGPGVPPAILESLFQPFAHGSRVGSLGLGLAVSRKLANAMGGDLRYKREAGLTIFELELRASRTL